MTELSRVWDGFPGGGGIGDAAISPYDDAEWAAIWQNIIGFGGMRANLGVFRGSGNSASQIEGLFVQATGPATATVSVNPGAAMVTGTLYTNDAIVSLAIAANGSPTLFRTDTVVLRKDVAAQTIRLAVVQGTLNASAFVPPTLTQTAATWEIPIADISLSPTESVVNEIRIRQRSEFVNAPDAVFLDGVLNNSGGTLEDGDAVVWTNPLAPTARAVGTTNVRNQHSPAGIWRGRTVNGAYGRVQVGGIGMARSAPGSVYAPSVGTDCVTGNTVKLLEKKSTQAGGSLSGYASANSFGVCLTNPDAVTGRFMMYINPKRRTPGFWYTSSTANNSINSAVLTQMTGFSISAISGQYAGGGILSVLIARVNRSFGPRFQFRMNGTLPTGTLDPGSVVVSNVATVDVITVWNYWPQANLFSNSGPFTLDVWWCNNTGGATPINAGEISMIAMEIGNEVP